VVSALTDRTLHVYAAKLIVLTELFIAVGLWWRGTRYAAVWVAVCFHLSIEASADVEVFSYLGIAALVIWAVPSTRDRMLGIDLSAAGQRWLAIAVRRLDWLAPLRGGGDHPGAGAGRRQRRACLSRRSGTDFRAEPAAGHHLVHAPAPAGAQGRRPREASQADGQRSRSMTTGAGSDGAFPFLASPPPYASVTWEAAARFAYTRSIRIPWFLWNMPAR